MDVDKMKTNTVAFKLSVFANYTV